MFLNFVCLFVCFFFEAAVSVSFDYCIKFVWHGRAGIGWKSRVLEMDIDSDPNNLNVKSLEEVAAMQMDSSDSSAAQVIILTQPLFVCFVLFFILFYIFFSFVFTYANLFVWNFTFSVSFVFIVCFFYIFHFSCV